MDFLPSLRLANLFGPNSRGSGFGQPEIDNGNVGQMLRQIVPTARTMNEEEHRRRKDLMTHQANLELPGRGRVRRPINSSGPEGGRGPLTRSSMPAQNVNAPQGGLSPVQAMWGAERASKLQHERGMERQGSELSARYRAALEERKMQDQGSMDRLLLELGSRERTNDKNLDAQAAIEDKKHQRTVESGNIGHGRDLEKIRLQNSFRPEPAPQTEIDKQRGMTNQLNRLRMEHPQVYALLEFDDEGRPAIKSSATPEQRANITAYLFGRQK